MVSAISGSLPFSPYVPACPPDSGSNVKTFSKEEAEKQHQSSSVADTAQQSAEKVAPEVEKNREAGEERAKKTDSTKVKSANGELLSEEELNKVEKLRQRDQEVRAHEAAHLAGAGQYARGGMSFSYENGPDGKRYAVGGEVNVDTSPVPGDPQATLQKANTIRAAAMAPAEPSAQDRAVAAQASQMAAQARQDLAKQQAEATRASSEKSEDNKDDSLTHSAKRAEESYKQVEAISEKSPSSFKLDLVI